MPSHRDVTGTGSRLDGRFADAVAYAARAHRDQVRKGSGTPYLAHVLAVVTLVLEFGGSEAQATAAVLHDVVEDQGGRARLDDVRLHFGEDVAELVEALSDSVVEPGRDKAPWRQRKETYLAELREAVNARSPATLVSACDKLHNAEAIVADATDPSGAPGPEVFQRFTGRADGTAWYYRELLDIFRSADLPPRLLGRLHDAVDALDRAARRAMAEASPSRTVEVHGSPITGENVPHERRWREQVAAAVTGQGSARSIRLDFRLESGRRDLDLDNLVRPAVAGLRDAAVLARAFVGLDCIHATKSVGERPGLVVTLDPTDDRAAWPPSPRLLEVQADWIPGDESEGRRRWNDRVRDSYVDDPIEGTAWVEIAVSDGRSLVGVMKPVLDGLEPILGRDPRGRADYRSPNDHLVTDLRMTRGRDGDHLLVVRCGVTSGAVVRPEVG